MYIKDIHRFFITITKVQCIHVTYILYLFVCAGIYDRYNLVIWHSLCVNDNKLYGKVNRHNTLMLHTYFLLSASAYNRFNLVNNNS